MREKAKGAVVGAVHKHAHQSGDGVTVAHCPFCFSGDTRYITRDGVKSFAETVGSTQWVLTADRHDRTGGRWVQAHIHEFGEQQLLKVTLKRNQRTRIIEATPEHRWLVKANLKRRIARGQINRKGKPRGWRPDECSQGHHFRAETTRVRKNDTRECLVCAKAATSVGGASRSTDRDVLTRDLRPGMRLSHLRKSGVGDLTPSEDGIRYGIVFGDGHGTGKNAAMVTLWGEKDKQLLRYFPDRRYTEVATPGGVRGISVSGDLYRWMKEVPDASSHSAEYLYGWLAGYFAADGTVSKQGAAQICSAKLDHLEAVRDIALRLGIASYGIVTQMRIGFEGREPSAIHSLNFVNSTLNEDFFLIDEHRNRWQFRNYSYERLGWTVVSVEETGRTEPVYCAVVPETHSFALEDHVWTGNCGSGQVIGRSDGNTECSFCNQAFMIRVQPQFSTFPQTMNGQPVQIPGMPAPDPGMDPMAGGGAPPGVEPGGDAGAAESGGDLPPGGAPDDSDDDGSEDSGGDGPPWAKKESYRTATGRTLGRGDYVTYLAGLMRSTT